MYHEKTSLKLVEAFYYDAETRGTVCVILVLSNEHQLVQQIIHCCSLWAYVKVKRWSESIFVWS
jgi:hypothetical protein